MKRHNEGLVKKGKKIKDAELELKMYVLFKKYLSRASPDVDYIRKNVGLIINHCKPFSKEKDMWEFFEVVPWKNLCVDIHSIPIFVDFILLEAEGDTEDIQCVQNVKDVCKLIEYLNIINVDIILKWQNAVFRFLTDKCIKQRELEDCLCSLVFSSPVKNYQTTKNITRYWLDRSHWKLDLGFHRLPEDYLLFAFSKSFEIVRETGKWNFRGQMPWDPYVARDFFIEKSKNESQCFYPMWITCFGSIGENQTPKQFLIEKIDSIQPNNLIFESISPSELCHVLYTLMDLICMSNEDASYKVSWDLKVRWKGNVFWSRMDCLAKILELWQIDKRFLHLLMACTNKLGSCSEKRYSEILFLSQHLPTKNQIKVFFASKKEYPETIGVSWAQSSFMNLCIEKEKWSSSALICCRVTRYLCGYSKVMEWHSQLKDMVLTIVKIAELIEEDNISEAHDLAKECACVMTC